jgi:hypothetical protein
MGEPRLVKPLDLSPKNRAKAEHLYQRYEGFIYQAYTKKVGEVRYQDREDLKSFIQARFWISCIRADHKKCSSYLYQTARFAALKYTARAIIRYKQQREESARI